MAIFADRLKELRKKSNLTQKALAEIVGSSERGIQNYELENNKPTSDVLIKLADYFNVSTDYLLGRVTYTQNSDGNITVKTPADIFNLDTDELKKKLAKE